MKITIKMFYLFRSIGNLRSIIAQFWFSKSLFYAKNRPNLSDFVFIEKYKNRRRTFITDIF
jgi:hypothetical protein